MAAGQTFSLGVNVFDLATEVMAAIETGFRAIAAAGVGPQRSPIMFLEIETLDPISIDLSASAEPVESIRVQFLTPTELKGIADWVQNPEFSTLACRIRDRVSTLCSLYGEGPLSINFEEFARQSSSVETGKVALHQREVSRRSTRSGQCHRLGGVIGEVQYSGQIGPFLPYLEAARWTGVGRHTVWGQGELAAYPLPGQPCSDSSQR